MSEAATPICSPPVLPYRAQWASGMSSLTRTDIGSEDFACKKAAMTRLLDAAIAAVEKGHLDMGGCVRMVEGRATFGVVAVTLWNREVTG